MRSAFKKVQYDFAAHLKDPDNVSAPSEIEDRRMAIYRGLFYRNIEGFIANAYPVSRKFYSDHDWHEMVREFFSTHRSKTPYFKDISREFLNYLIDERDPRAEDPVFLAQLAHYEWIEIKLTFSDLEIKLDGIDRTGDLLKGLPILSPLAELHCYDFPVHRIQPCFKPEEKSDSPIFLMVYRDRKDNVGFLELNPMTAMLVGLLQDEPRKTGEQLMDIIADRFPNMDSQLIKRGGEEILKQLYSKDILLGTRDP